MSLQIKLHQDKTNVFETFFFFKFSKIFLELSHYRYSLSILIGSSSISFVHSIVGQQCASIAHKYIADIDSFTVLNFIMFTMWKPNAQKLFRNNM